MNENLKREVRWAIEALDPNFQSGTLEGKCRWAGNILDPKTQHQVLARIESYRRSKGVKARQRAVEDACIIANNAMRYFLEKEDLTYEILARHVGKETAKAIMVEADSKAFIQMQKGEGEND